MRLIALFILLACSCSVNAAKVCTWKDGHGRTHFGNAGVPRGAHCYGVEPNVIETKDDDERDQAALQKWTEWRLREPEPTPAPAPGVVIVDER